MKSPFRKLSLQTYETYICDIHTYYYRVEYQLKHDGQVPKEISMIKATFILFWYDLFKNRFKNQIYTFKELFWRLAICFDLYNHKYYKWSTKDGLTGGKGKKFIEVRF